MTMDDVDPNFFPQQADAPAMSFRVKWGSRMHEILIERVERANKNGWEPRWFFCNKNMNITALETIDDNYFLVRLGEIHAD